MMTCRCGAMLMPDGEGLWVCPQRANAQVHDPKNEKNFPTVRKDRRIEAVR